MGKSKDKSKDKEEQPPLLAGVGYMILNVIRILNILALLAVTAASILLVMKVPKLNRFHAFEVFNHFVRIFLALCLVLTELPIFRNYLANDWPVFDYKSGFGVLGVAMFCLGVNVLSELNKNDAQEEVLGGKFFRVVISAGIISLVMGAANIFSNFVFRDKVLGLTARQIRKHGAMAFNEAAARSVDPDPKRRQLISTFLRLKRYTVEDLESARRAADDHEANITAVVAKQKADEESTRARELVLAADKEDKTVAERYLAELKKSRAQQQQQAPQASKSPQRPRQQQQQHQQPRHPAHIREGTGETIDMNMADRVDP